jgi:hypothetical protein
MYRVEVQRCHVSRDPEGLPASLECTHSQTP